MSTLARPALRRAAVAIVSTCVAVAVLPGLASAAPEPAPEPAPAKAERCAADSLCTWPEPDFTGEISEIPENKQPGCHPLPRAAASAINDTGFAADFYEGADCQGTPITSVGAGRKAPSFIKATSVKLKGSSSGRSGGSTRSGSGGTGSSGADEGTRPKPDATDKPKPMDTGSPESGETGGSTTEDTERPRNSDRSTTDDAP